MSIGCPDDSSLLLITKGCARPRERNFKPDAFSGSFLFGLGVRREDDNSSKAF